MSLDKSFFERDTNITAKVICDSISEQGIRLTTFEVEAPRIILAEINTHNAISKNCSSTRAITLSKAIEQVEKNGFIPLYWGKKQSGMAAEQEVEGVDLYDAIDQWNWTKRRMISSVKFLDELQVHKQIAGRLLEPFQMVKQVLTATDLDNFFNLRIHPTAQPEILMLAYKMYKALQESVPNLLKAGEWHLPYIKFDRDNEGKAMYLPFDEDRVVGWVEYSLEQAQRISASCCAQTSYRNTDDSLCKADDVFNKLIKADVLHSSPMEHQATPVKERGTELDSINDNVLINHIPPSTWEEGVTHMNRQGQLCSGNLRGWVQYRHLLPNNTSWKFDFEKRMELFK